MPSGGLEHTSLGPLICICALCVLAWDPAESPETPGTPWPRAHVSVMALRGAVLVLVLITLGPVLVISPLRGLGSRGSVGNSIACVKYVAPRSRLRAPGVDTPREALEDAPPHTCRPLLAALGLWEAEGG